MCEDLAHTSISLRVRLQHNRNDEILCVLKNRSSISKQYHSLLMSNLVCLSEIACRKIKSLSEFVLLSRARETRQDNFYNNHFEPSDIYGATMTHHVEWPFLRWSHFYCWTKIGVCSIESLRLNDCLRISCFHGTAISKDLVWKSDLCSTFNYTRAVRSIPRLHVWFISSAFAI